MDHFRSSICKKLMSGFNFSHVPEIITKAKYFESQMSIVSRQPLPSPPSFQPTKPSMASSTKSAPTLPASSQQKQPPSGHPGQVSTRNVGNNCNKPGHLSANCSLKSQLLTNAEDEFFKRN